MARIAPLSVTSRLERWAFKSPFRITGYEWTGVEFAYVELERDGARGRGECAGIYYKGDPPEHCLAEIKRVSGDLARGASREDLPHLLGPGGARNALDCAFWELEAKLQVRPVWQLAGVRTPQPLLTTYTVGADTPQVMAQRATEFSDARAIKLKLTGTAADAHVVRAVRKARPDVWLAVDANQGFTRASLGELLPALQEARVQLIEQPFPIDRDADMDGLDSPIPVAADESAQTAEDLLNLVDRFNVVNIKLDKCGGLSAGLAMAAQARELGLGVMVGNMCGTSLAMAPAFVLGQLAGVVDLDGPLLLQNDRTPAVAYTDGHIWCPENVWGSGGP